MSTPKPVNLGSLPQGAGLRLPDGALGRRQHGGIIGSSQIVEDHIPILVATGRGGVDLVGGEGAGERPGAPGKGITPPRPERSSDYAVPERTLICSYEALLRLLHVATIVSSVERHVDGWRWKFCYACLEE